MNESRLAVFASPDRRSAAPGDSTDTELKQAVFAEMNLEPSLDAAQIGVEVEDGIVTLEGEVNSEAAKLDAERAAARVPGVKALADDMDVSSPP